MNRPGQLSLAVALHVSGVLVLVSAGQEALAQEDGYQIRSPWGFIHRSLGTEFNINDYLKEPSTQDCPDQDPCSRHTCPLKDCLHLRGTENCYSVDSLLAILEAALQSGQHEAQVKGAFQSGGDRTVRSIDLERIRIDTATRQVGIHAAFGRISPGISNIDWLGPLSECECHARSTGFNTTPGDLNREFASRLFPLPSSSLSMRGNVAAASPRVSIPASRASSAAPSAARASGSVARASRVTSRGRATQSPAVASSLLTGVKRIGSRAPVSSLSGNSYGAYAGANDFRARQYSMHGGSFPTARPFTVGRVPTNPYGARYESRTLLFAAGQTGMTDTRTRGR